MQVTRTLAAIDAVLRELTHLRRVLLDNLKTLPTLELLNSLLDGWKHQTIDIAQGLNESKSPYTEAPPAQSFELHLMNFVSEEEPDTEDQPRDELTPRDKLPEVRRIFMLEDFHAVSYAMRLSLQALPPDPKAAGLMLEEDRRLAFNTFEKLRSLGTDKMNYLHVLSHEKCSNSFEVAVNLKGELLVCNLEKKTKLKHQQFTLRNKYADTHLEYKRNFFVDTSELEVTRIIAINSENKLVVLELDTSANNCRDLKVKLKKTFTNFDIVHVITSDDGDFLALSSKGVVSSIQKVGNDYTMTTKHVRRPIHEFEEEGYQFTCLCQGYGKMIFAAFSPSHKKVLLFNTTNHKVLSLESPVHHMQIILFSYVRLLICIDYNGAFHFFFLYSNRFISATCKLRGSTSIPKDTYEKALRETISLVISDYHQRLRDREFGMDVQDLVPEPSRENLMDLFFPEQRLGFGFGLGRRLRGMPF